MSGADVISPVDPRRALDMLRDAANAGENAGDTARFTDALKRASRLADSGKPIDQALKDLVVGVGTLLEGRTEGAVPLVRDAISRAGDVDDPIWLLWGAFGAGAIGDHVDEASLLRRATGIARATGAIDTLTRALLVNAVEGVFSGRFSVATEATEGLRLADDAGLGNTMSVFQAILCWLAATKGREQECREYAARLSGPVSATGMALANSIAEWALAILDLTGGRPADAVARLEAVRTGPPGVGHPYVALMFTPDLIEASARTGRHEPARAAFEAYVAFAQAGAPTWVLALAWRCRALLSTSDDAEQGFLEANRLHADGHRAFDHARTRLAHGGFLRRERRRKDAREQLRPALEAFERLGVEPWAARARAELRASGETVRARDPSTIDQLTPQELQITRLVAEGLSNRDVAAQLFLSPRTIEYHLRSVFTKLDVTSRTQLVRLVPADEPVRAPSPS